MYLSKQAESIQRLVPHILWCESYLQGEGIWIPSVCTGENGINYVTSFKKRKKGACCWGVTNGGREVGPTKGSIFPTDIYVDDGWRWSRRWNICDDDG